MAGVLGIEPRSSVLETDILTAVLYPCTVHHIIVTDTGKNLEVFRLLVFCDADCAAETFVGDVVSKSSHRCVGDKLL